MIAALARYARWLHLRWPAGGVEPLPDVGPGGRTNVPGLSVAGDLAGVPLLKFAADSGTRAVRAIARELGATPRPENTLDLLVLGAGVSGMAAALEARALGLSFQVIEAARPFATIEDFPRAKPIFTYPPDLTPEGALQVSAPVKEELLEELRAQVRDAAIPVVEGRAQEVRREGGRMVVRLEDGRTISARRVLVAIGRSGDYRRLGVPGEDLGKVFHRLHDPAEFRDRDVLVVGGGDSALEAAIALTESGARTTLSYRRPGFSRAKPANTTRVQALAADGMLALKLGTKVTGIAEGSVTLADRADQQDTLPNDAVFTLIGREAPLAFLRRAGIRIRGESTRRGTVGMLLFMALLALMYDWKSSGFLDSALWSHWPWPGNAAALLGSAGSWWQAQVADRATWIGTLAVSMKNRSFYYTLAYTLVVGIFGIRRARRRATPYVTRQTWTLFLVQAIPLFLLPELVLPWLGYNGVFDHGLGRAIGDRLFEPYVSAADLAARHWPAWGHPRAYWRAYGFILAWPLNVYNVFTHQPLWTWIGIGAVQTLVLIPLAVWRWGKGAYCGWICSCGALAETLGDTRRTRMPHGPAWNRLNLLGQVVLGAAVLLLALRIAAWALPASPLGGWFDLLFEGRGGSGRLVNPLSYKWVVDVFLGGVLGVGLYFRWSGRAWCRFACPLAAWMHVVGRFSRFAIVAEKKKCISCNVCTSVCHQGIDVMSFANRGLPMRDPECVRCSACVQSCPTGVLQFGQVACDDQVISVDSLMASPVRARTTPAS